MAFLATSNADASRAFYRDVLGMKLVEEHEFALVFDAFGTMLRVQKTANVLVPPYTSFGLEVDDIVRTVDDLKVHGIVGVRYPQFEQDERGIWTTPDGGRVFWFRDPDGSLLSLTQFA